MNQILKHYFEGEFSPEIEINRQNETYLALEQQLSELLERSRSAFSKSEFEAFEDAVFDICGMMQFPVAEEAFVKGVRCGFHIMTEPFFVPKR